MVRRRTTGSDRQLTHEQAMNEIRRLSTLNDPSDPEWDELKPSAVKALASKHVVGMSPERAEAIFDVFRRSPHLIPPAAPPGLMPSTGE